jgi:hypothetical protein
VSDNRVLQQQIRQVARLQPDIEELREKLLAIGGEELVALTAEWGFDPLVPLQTEYGILMTGPVRLKTMDAGRCHGNVKTLWQRKTHGGLDAEGVERLVDALGKLVAPEGGASLIQRSSEQSLAGSN